MSKDWSTVHGQVHDRVGPQFPYHPTRAKMDRREPRMEAVKGMHAALGRTRLQRSP